MKTKPEIQIAIFEILIKEEFLLYLDCATYLNKRKAEKYFNEINVFLTKEQLGWIDLALDIESIMLIEKTADEMLVSALNEFADFISFERRAYYQDTVVEAKKLYEIGIKKESNNESDFLEYIREAAELGYPKAQTYLAECYQFGENVKIKDEELAIAWYVKAAILGERFAQFRIGTYWQYESGIDLDSGIDYTEAFKWYKRAAIRGCAIAQSSLAGLYIEGLGVGKNEKEAFRWYKSAVKNGDKSYYQLGECYEKGIGVENNKSKAIEMYKKAAICDDIFGLWAKQRLKELEG